MENNGIPYFYKNGTTYYVKEPAEGEKRIADSLEKLVQLIDYQNKMLTDIASTLRKRK